MARAIAIVFFVIATGTPGPVFAQVTEDEAVEPVEPAPGLGNIVGSPEPGPDPTDAGDRGGWAQLGLAVLLFGAIGFIISRIVAGMRTDGRT